MLRSRFKLEEGWTTLLLLTSMLLSVVWSVRAADWTDGLGILPWTALASVLVGVVLAKSRRVPGILAHLLGLVVGVGWMAFVLSAVFNSIVAPYTVGMPLAGLSARLTVMYEQAVRWLLNPTAAEAWLSNFMFVVTLTAATWALGYSSAWFVFRSHWVWGAIVPAGAACVLNIYYAPPRLVFYFMVYCLCALLLAVRLHVYTRQVTWKEAEVNYNLDVDLTFLRGGMIMSVLALLLAWTIPAAARSPRLTDFWGQFEEPWQEVRTVWTRFFTSLNYQGPSGLMQFGRTMTLGGGANLSNIPVLEVQASAPRYWRAVAYDRYTGSGWVNTDDAQLVVPSNDVRLNPVTYRTQQAFTHTVRMLESGETLLFYVGQPLRTSQSARASLSYVANSDGQRSTEVSMLSVLTPLARNATYTLESAVSRTSVGQLRAAGTDYPRWVLERYLQLPSALPARIPALARQISAAAAPEGQTVTAYDQAEAIQAYLRRIPYVRTITPPPPGYDPIDWFLFENRRGFCDYYASAMVVLCRALGIPARISQGYAVGEYDPASQSYRVRQLDAHSWPELYFPGYGWIEFEPTASQPLIARATTDEVPILPGLDLVSGETRTEEEDKYGPDEAGGEDEDIVDVMVAASRPWYSRFLVLGLVVLALLVAACAGLLGWWQFSLRGLSLAESVYEQIRRIGILLGVPHRAHETPMEYGESVAPTVSDGQDDVRQLIAAYVKQCFGRRGLCEAEERELQQRWRRLRPLLWRKVLTHRLRRRRPATPAWVPSSSLRPPTSMG